MIPKVFKNHAVLIVIFGILLILLTFLIQSIDFVSKNNSINSKEHHFSNSSFQQLTSRDFFRYECKNSSKIKSKRQGLDDFIPDKKSWYICQDDKLKLVEDKCIVLSFVVTKELSFEKQISKLYKCQIETFCPNFDDNLLRIKRFHKYELKNATSLILEKNWKIHKIVMAQNDSNNSKRSFDKILKYVKLNENLIDVLRVRLENVGDWEAINFIDMSYLCKYVKQVILEAHLVDEKNFENLNFMKSHLETLRKFEKCYMLFNRNTHFLNDIPVKYKQKEISGLNNTNELFYNVFKNELELINYLIMNGELFFVNSNFIK